MVAFGVCNLGIPRVAKIAAVHGYVSVEKKPRSSWMSLVDVVVMLRMTEKRPEQGNGHLCLPLVEEVDSEQQKEVDEDTVVLPFRVGVLVV